MECSQNQILGFELDSTVMESLKRLTYQWFWPYLLKNGPDEDDIFEVF